MLCVRELGELGDRSVVGHQTSHPLLNYSSSTFTGGKMTHLEIYAVHKLVGARVQPDRNWPASPVHRRLDLSTTGMVPGAVVPQGPKPVPEPCAGEPLH